MRSFLCVDCDWESKNFPLKLQRAVEFAKNGLPKTSNGMRRILGSVPATQLSGFSISERFREKGGSTTSSCTVCSWYSWLGLSLQLLLCSIAKKSCLPTPSPFTCKRRSPSSITASLHDTLIGFSWSPLASNRTLQSPSICVTTLLYSSSITASKVDHWLLYNNLGSAVKLGSLEDFVIYCNWVKECGLEGNTWTETFFSSTYFEFCTVTFSCLNPAVSNPTVTVKRKSSDALSLSLLIYPWLLLLLWLILVTILHRAVDVWRTELPKTSFMWSWNLYSLPAIQQWLWSSSLNSIFDNEGEQGGSTTLICVVKETDSFSRFFLSFNHTMSCSWPTSFGRTSTHSSPLEICAFSHRSVTGVPLLLNASTKTS